MAYVNREIPEGLEDRIGRVPRSRSGGAFVVGVVGALLGLGCVVMAVLTGIGFFSWAPRYAADWVIGAFLLGVGPQGWIFMREFRRLRSINEHFPDFLRDLAESARGGMTLPRALHMAAKGNYGSLTAEIVVMNKQVEWGVDFQDALERFAKRIDSGLIKRTVNLILEARRSGGNVVDILTAAADDAQEIKQIVEQRQNQMRPYSVVVYVTFIVFLGITVLLQWQLLPTFETIAKEQGGSIQFGGISLQAGMQARFNELFFHSVMIQAVVGGLVAGLLRRDHPFGGLRSIALLLLLSWFCFRVVTQV